MWRWSFALVVVARVAAADPEPIRLAYDAPAGCPAEADVVARLADHASMRRVSAGAAREFSLAIAHDEAGFRGVLAVHDGAAPAATRDVAAASCDEVVSALVLVAALAIEERAPSVVEPAPPPEPRHAATETPWRLAVGAGVARYSGMTPSALFGVPIYVAASHGRQQLRATFDTTASDDVAMASFRWTAGRIEGCPIAWQLGAFSAAPCAGVQLGALRGSGATAMGATTGTRPWIAPELVGRLAVRFGRAALELEGTAAAPLVRDRYYLAPSTTIHQVPALAYGVATSVAIEFR